MRLQKYMAECGVASRRKCEEIISEGRVSVNGIIISEAGTQVFPERGDVVCVDKEEIFVEEKKVYIMFFKPCKVVTTAKDQFGRACVTDFFHDIKERILPVGRLDYDTEGLLLMSNDGDFIYKLTHPAHEIDKVYIAEVKGIPSSEDIDFMKKPILIDGRYTSGAEVIIPNKDMGNILEIIIHEGRNRQVRKICDAAGYPIIKLKRTAIGKLKLNLKLPGEWRYLTDSEIQQLSNMSK